MILSVASQKGGTGKTTTSISLAAGLARKGKRVLLIDTDSQANSSKVLLPNYPEIDANQTLYATILERKPLPIHPTSVPNLDIVPAHILLSNTDIELTSAIDHREARVRTQVETLRDTYEQIIIDCPPALSWLTINAFTASDQVLVVVSPGYFELDSTVQLGKSIQNVREYFNPSLCGFVFTMSEPTINSATSLKILRQTYTDDVRNTVIPKNVDIRDAHFKQQDIFAYAPQSKSARAYANLITEIFGRMSKDRVNPDKLANELAGASAFFRRPAEVPSQAPDPVTPLTPPAPDPATSSDVVTSRRHSVTTSSETPRPQVGFDLNRPTTSRDSLRLSTDETKTLDELRATLKWDYDLSVSKNDICRAALHHLLEDFQLRGDKSAAVSRLKRKVTGR